MPKFLKIVDQKLSECPEGEAQLLVYTNPNDAEKRLLIDACHVDEHTLNSCLDPDEPARVEQEPDHMAIIFKRPKRYAADDRLQFRVMSVGMFSFSARLIVVASEDCPIFDGRAFTRVHSLRDVVLKVIYRSVQHFIEHLKVINMISGELELQISRAMENTNLIHMFMLEKSLVYYLSAIQANGAIIERLRLNASNPATPGFTPENLEFIDDLAIENKQCYELTRIYSDILAGMMDARASIVNNNLNLLMKTLTVFMLAIMWPPLVCGFFSMNVKLPVDQTGALWPFFVVLLASFGPIAGILVYRRFLANGKSRFWRRLWRRKPA